MDEKVTTPAKLIIAAVIMFGIVPVASIAGWFYWLASETRPWMLDFGSFIAVFIMVSWPVEFLLSRNCQLRQLTGGGRFHKKVVKSISLYLLLVIVVGLNDLDHDRDNQTNLREYVLTIAFFTVFFLIIELVLPVIARTWAALRPGSDF